MASAGYTNENKNFIRALRLQVDIGTSVLKELLKKHVNQHGSIANFLKTHSKKLKNCLQKYTLQKHQYECLYPAGGQPVDIETWDISLLCAVLNICCHLSSIEKQAIDKIRNTRNTVFCHTSNFNLNDAAFSSVWTDLETEYVNILNCIGDANFAQEITNSMRDVKEKRIDGDEIASDDIQGLLERLASITENSASDVERLASITENSASNLELLTSITKSSAPETKLNDRILNLQSYLLKAYIEYTNMKSLPIGPFGATDVEKIYVEENLDDMSIEIYNRIESTGNCHINIPYSDYQKLFKLFHAEEETRHIVIAGSAGRGKTTFCLELVSMWCSAVQKSLRADTSLTLYEQELLDRFNLLYFVSIQNAVDEGSVIKMIAAQLFIENKGLMKDVEECFKEIPDNCLVIIDGLDEWHDAFSNKLPKFDQLNFCRILWTTRHSKLYLLSKLQNIRILDIAPLSKESVEKLARNILSIIHKESSPTVDEQVRYFLSDLMTYKMQLLAENPLILMYLVYHWYEEHGLEDSVTLNYIGVLNLVMKTKEASSNETQQVVSSFPNLPSALAYKSNISHNAPVLRRLCPFAYECCLQSLYVFEEGSVCDTIGKADTQKCLQSGLLSSVVHMTCQQPNSPKRRIKFFHKTLQELLAAIWICWKDPKSHRELEHFLKEQGTIQKIQEMSLILIFVCGIDPTKAEIISKHVATVALRDEELKNYRQSLQGRYSFRSSEDVSMSYRKIKSLQQLILECQKEMQYRYSKNSTRHYLVTNFGTIFGMMSDASEFQLYDIIIADRLDKSVCKLLNENTKSLRSIYIDLPKAESTEKIELAICKTTEMEKLTLDQTSSLIIYKLTPLQMQRLRSLSLCLDKIDKLPESMSHLVNITGMSLSISGSHRVVEELGDILHSLANLKELELESIVCEENRHENHHCEIAIDLSNCNNLKKLKLEDVRSSRATLPTSVQLEEIRLSGAVSNLSSCISRLSESMSLSLIVLGDFKPFIWNEPDFKAIKSELPRWYYLEYVYLIGINFERYGMAPTFSAQKNLKYLSLEDIQLSRSGWIKLLLSLVADTDREIESVAEVQIITITTTMHKDIVSRIKGENASMNVKRIFLDLKLHQCRDKLLRLSELRCASTV